MIGEILVGREILARNIITPEYPYHPELNKNRIPEEQIFSCSGVGPIPSPSIGCMQASGSMVGCRTSSTPLPKSQSVL